MTSSNEMVHFKFKLWLRCYLAVMTVFWRAFKIVPNPGRVGKIIRAGTVIIKNPANVTH